jgi:hypothetical protein
VSRAGAVIPVDMFIPERKDDVLLLLAALPLDPRDKKTVLWEWGRQVGVLLTKDDYDQAGARD